jgi:hypothetical protein
VINKPTGRFYNLTQGVVKKNLERTFALENAEPALRKAGEGHPKKNALTGKGIVD